ncbi:muscarinic acetylcholine receptor M2-like [Ylistrum balloti]|uniref:muscarinic acetylcholine receptor M2-like n=1 Tax=Ylistrum balloti TaxID=509963 RepID=UPI002905D62E|nr:muscarinic acetylcholine receptor M2-like [Ylistrum balloti]
MVTSEPDVEHEFRSRYEHYILSSKVIIVVCDVVMALTIIVGLVGNVCICVCIWKNKHLRTYININLVSSCVANIIGCTCLLPIRIQLYTGYTMFSSVQIMCGIGTFFRTFVDTMQFFMLAMASFERYQAVANPFKKVGLRKRSTVLVITSWTFAVSLGVFSAIMFIDSSLYVPCYFLDGAPNWTEYDQYLIFPLGMTLLCVIIVFYALILKTLFKHSVKMSRHKNKRKVAPDQLNINSENASVSFVGNNNMKGSTGSSQMFNVSSQNGSDQKDSTDSKNPTPTSMTLNVPGKSNTNTNRTKETTVHDQMSTSKAISTSSSLQDSTIQVVEMDGTVKMAKRNDETVVGAVCLMNNKNRENGRRRVELKASKKIAILFGTFTCCFIPLPVYVVSKSITGNIVLSYSMFCILVALATLGSSVIAINPVLYALLNRPLNSAMKRLLHFDRIICQWKAS